MMTDPAAPRPGTHLDPDQLADLAEGVLEPAAADLARTHLASCRLCASDLALIAGEDSDLYGAGLGELLPPAPIPQDVVVRIEAALHREPPLGTGGPTVQTAGRATAQPPRRRLRLALGSLAGATLVAVAAIGVVSATGGGENKSASNSTVEGQADTRTGDKSGTGGGSPESPALGGAPGTSSPSESFSALSIEQQAEGLLGQHRESPATGQTGKTGKTQCTPDIVPTGTKPIASTLTAYQGQPAWLLLYAEPGSTKTVDVYVVNSDSCGSDNLGHVVYQTTVTRP